MSRIFAIGETVYDIIFKNTQPVAAKAGGSTLNTSVSLGRLGLDVNFISDLGNDIVGDIILSFLSANGVSTACIERYDNRKTSIAIAFLNEKNDASYTFYKDFPEIRLSRLKYDFEEGDIILFGSIFAVTESLRPAVLKFIHHARAKGCILIYDPNFRKSHQHELENLKPYIIENLSLADLVRGSDEDFNLIFGLKNANDTFKFLLDKGCRNLVYTANSKDVFMMTEDHVVSAVVPVIEPVSTIGAGDNFNAGLIWTIANEGVTKKGMELLPVQIMEKILANGSLFASEVCMSYDNYISSEFAERFKNKYP
jgi:fructokinase